MIKLTEEMEKAMDLQYKKVIFAYLKNRIAEDEALAEAVKKENKSIYGVLNYIKSEAKKQAQGNVAVIPDEEVFGWAVHYILEDELDYEKGDKNENRKVVQANEKSGSKNIEPDQDNDGEELEKKSQKDKPVKKDTKSNNKPFNRTEKKPMSIEESLAEFYAESELFRGL